MGIEKFHTWLKNNYYNSISEYDTTSYDHVYIDLNYVLHRLVSYSSSENELITRTLDAIKTIANTNASIKTLNLVADGSASYAKILLQKKRRLQTAQSMFPKNYVNSQTDDGNSDDNNSNEKDKSIEDTIIFQKKMKRINPLYLTPGTLFMQKFNTAIRNLITNEIDANIKVNFNLADEPDESEFKICRYIISNTSSVFDTHLIFSSDADIVLISLALIRVHNIFIVIQQGRDNQTYTISIDRLLDQHMDIYGYHMLKRLDFVFLSILLGNDYFPKLRCAEFQKLWKLYKSTVQPYETIVNVDFTINIKIFHKFLIAFYANMPTKFKTSEISDITNTHVKDYLYGLSWCIHLYATGNYLDYDYLYFGESIHPMSIIVYLMKNGFDNIKLEQQINHPIPSEIYPVLVLPYSAKTLIPKKYHFIIDKKLMFMYDEEFCSECVKFRNSIRLPVGNVPNNYSMKKYILHRKTHCVDDPKNYIDNIVQILNTNQ